MVKETRKQSTFIWDQTKSIKSRYHLNFSHVKEEHIYEVIGGSSFAFCKLEVLKQ